MADFLTDWVQTHPKLLMAASTVMNTADIRNWTFTIVLYFLDLVINISSICFALDTDRPAVACMSLGIFLMALEIPFIGFYLKYALEQSRALKRAFEANDSNKDGLLTRNEVEKLLTELPKGTFSLEFSKNLKSYSLDNVLWCHYQPRMYIFRFLELSVAWLMFFASLMLIKADEPITSLVAIQGVVSVIGIMMVLSDFFENYFRKYRSKTTLLRYACVFAYIGTLLLIFAVLLAGYGFTSLIYANRVTWPEIDVNTTAVPQEDLVGFVTGWFLTAFVIAAFSLLACLNFTCVLLGQSEVHISHVGQDDPVKLLGTRASIFKSSNQPYHQEYDEELPKPSFNASQLELPPPPPPAVLPPPPPAIMPQSSSMTIV